MSQKEDNGFNNSLVSVICLCHNQKTYVKQAFESVKNQTHKNIELIVVDDGSEDGSKEKIRSVLPTNTPFIDIPTRGGNCHAFNQGLAIANGDYIIDLAADDLLLPNRIEEGLKTFDKYDIGVEYCDVEVVNTREHTLFIHSEKYPPKWGDIYVDLIERYFISPPGMMIKRDVMDVLGGYDESLSYEDFDFWMRSSRQYAYGYTNKVLVKKRQLKGSLSTRQRQFQSMHQQSTYHVCEKVEALNQSKEEDLALKHRCWYEIKQCLKTGNVGLILNYLQIIRRLTIHT